MLTRWRILLVVLLATFGAAGPAAALVPRVAICGRVTVFVDAVPPADRIVTLGTQEARRLSLGSSVPKLGEEICIWGTDVVNVNPPVPDPAPKGIVGYAIAPVASIGCAEVVTATAASFVMPGEGGSALPNSATLTIPLNAPAGSGCVRTAVDAQGNPVAVVVPRASTPSPATASPSSPVRSLPNTSTLADRAAR